jgi:hypothetical protein
VDEAEHPIVILKVARRPRCLHVTGYVTET